MAKLLVSVRSIAEAEEALAGGVDVLDVKEPTRGSLGRAQDETIQAVANLASGLVPVSAAMGELAETPTPSKTTGMQYVKWGLAGIDHVGMCVELLHAARIRVRDRDPHCTTVVAAYADWQRAKSLSPQVVAELAIEHNHPVLLLDTWKKDGTHLLTWIAEAQLDQLVRQCREYGVQIALAGSLGRGDLARLKRLEPDFFAVRSAVCRDGDRTASVDRCRVRDLVRLLH